MAPSGIARVTTLKAVVNTIAASQASACRPRRHRAAATISPATQPTCPTVVSACSWFDDGYAGHCTRAMATKATTATTTAMTPASTIWPTVVSALRIIVTEVTGRADARG